jgi:N-succinyldiaminopimelate aminotransferase
MNPELRKLQPYPFERLAALFNGVTPPESVRTIALHIGEPAHPAPQTVVDTLWAHRDGFSKYPKTAGEPWLRDAMAAWLRRRYGLSAHELEASTGVLPVNGSREALFSFTQAVVSRAGEQACVAMPNPFYQIYEGAALLAGATPLYLPECAGRPGLPDIAALTDADWQGCQLLFVCSPANPSGAVLDIDDWRALFRLADTHGFVIASDECYSELYPDESAPPMGVLSACKALGREGFRNCVAFHSLSKRSSLPGLRSGMVSGDSSLLNGFLLYRTYHGCAMPLPHQHASAAAWSDETHVIANRELYRRKFAAVTAELRDCLDVRTPEGGFYLWPRVEGDDTVFARELWRQEGVSVLPGCFLGRDGRTGNPGSGRVRIALVGGFDETVEAARRIRRFVTSTWNHSPR